MDSKGAGGRKVVMGIDSSEESAVSFLWALTNFVRPGDRLIAVYAQQLNYRDYPSINDGTDFGLDMYMSPDMLESIGKKAEEASQTLLERYMKVAAEAKTHCEGMVLRGDPRDKIVEMLEEIKAEVLIVGSRGLGAIKRAFLGSVSDYLAHHAPCPILIVKNKPEASPEDNPLETDYERRIVVAVDKSESASYAFTWALENFCKPTDHVTALHVTPPAMYTYPTAIMGSDELNMGSFYVNPETRENLEKSAHDAGEALLQQYIQQAKALNIPCEGRVVSGEARDVIMSEVGRLNANALVVGSRGMGLIRRAILGSVSDYVSHSCPCPVLIVRHPKDVHPTKNN
eukprot:TRINITY_DN22985_c0_g1_i1.p1 TRINITY_DN22985_c0_g1~~TRINITY_DN22985_c0_g1_i1.p1  ORF type:complete len:343 (-),score=68.25 TRINITY_DN22985_c0_g1_i1:541-1569(-)